MSESAVGFVHYSAPPTTGGVEAVMAAHARVFLAHGYEVTIVAGTGEAGALPEGTRLALLPELSSQQEEVLKISTELEAGHLPPEFERLAAQIEKALRPVVADLDTLIVHNVFSKHFNLPFTAALWRLLDQGVLRNCIAWCHDLSWSSPGSRHKLHDGYPWDLLRACREDVRYVTVSEERREEMYATFACPPDQVKVIYNGVDAGQLLGLNEKVARLLERMRWQDSDLLLLMPVRITRAKNIEFAMQVLAVLRERGRRAALLVTGPADPHSAEAQEYFASLLDLRGRLGLEGAFFFAAEGLDGQVAALSSEELGQLYRACDLVFLPSHREGFGMPVLEAGLAGVPLLSSEQVPAARELSGRAVTLYPAGASAESVAGQVVEHIQRRPGFDFKRRVRQSLTWEALFEREIEPLIMHKTFAQNQAFFDHLLTTVRAGQRYWLFLDYDGTLAEFVDSPDAVQPDAELIALLTRLAAHPERLRPVILSGRRLDHIRRLAPVPGMLLAGNYGIEYRTVEGEEVLALDLSFTRPVIERIKAAWLDLVAGYRGFFVEDKGYSLALHARDADEADLPRVLPQAQLVAEQALGSAPLRVLSVARFLEVSPQTARKSLSVTEFVKRFPWPDSKVLYFGDDDRDEEAFAVAKELGGDGVLVSRVERSTQATARLESPSQVRDFLTRLARSLE